MTETIDRTERWRSLVGDDVDAYKKAGFGRTGGLGTHPAVLVVDMTNMFVDPTYVVTSGTGGADAIARTAELIAVARKRGVPIFFSKRGSRKSPVERGALDSKWGFTSNDAWLNDPRTDEFPEIIAPQAGDTVVEKAKPSVFFETPLRSMLTHLKVDSLIICGISTSGCVRAAVTDAFSSNFRVVVPEECCFDRSLYAHNANLFDMDMKFADVDPLASVLNTLENSELGWPVAGAGTS